MTMTLEVLKTYYSGTLITQYRMKPRAVSTIKMLINQAWCDGLPDAARTCFDLDTAVGAQLDILGIIVGVPRNIYGLDLTNTFFEMTDYAASIAGTDMQLYADTADGPEIMLRYRSDAIYTLSDFEMRSLIKLKIIFNTKARTLKAIVEAMYEIFGAGVAIVDNLNSSITINVENPNQNTFAVAEYIGIIPKAMRTAFTVNNI